MVLEQLINTGKTLGGEPRIFFTQIISQFAKLALLFLLCLTQFGISPAHAKAVDYYSEANKLRILLKQNDKNIDLAKFKLTIDKMIDPSIDINKNIQKLDDMVLQIKSMLSPTSSSTEKMFALKKYLYRKGAWNDYQVYQYDFDDPMGTKIANKLLPNYMQSKKGNCVSMPILFTLLGDRLGINVTLAKAPKHIFVKFTDDSGKTFNLETTSGANFTRDIWYQQLSPMSETAIKKGIYLQPLNRKETMAAMAEVVSEHFLDTKEYIKSMNTSLAVNQVYRKSVSTMLRMGIAFYRILDRDYLSKYSNPSEIPVHERREFQRLSKGNHFWFNLAEFYGWKEPSKETDEKYLSTVKQAINKN